MIVLLEVFADNYLMFYYITAIFSMFALILLNWKFREEPIVQDQKKLVEELRQKFTT